MTKGNFPNEKKITFGAEHKGQSHIKKVEHGVMPLVSAGCAISSAA